MRAHISFITPFHSPRLSTLIVSALHSRFTEGQLHMQSRPQARPADKILRLVKKFEHSFLPLPSTGSPLPDALSACSQQLQPIWSCNEFPEMWGSGDTPGCVDRVHGGGAPGHQHLL